MSEPESTLGRRPLPPLSPRRRALRIVHSPDPASVGRSIEAWPVRLGRSVDGPGLIEDPRLSREHALITEPASPLGPLELEDQGSGNGTFVNGARVTRHRLAPGDVVSMGDTLLVLDQEPDPDLLPVKAAADATRASEVIGGSFTAARIRRAIDTVASGGSVLLLGETGSGKEVAARAIHRLSGRSGPFVAINCAAIPAELAEAELFGVRKGAFTGAAADRDGVFAQADGGTLLLDEIGDLPIGLQAKLLRVIETGMIQPLGANGSVSVNVRVIAATHIDLERSGFRSDLYARLGEWVLHLPPLAERKCDVLELWDRFVAGELDGKAPPRTAELSEALLLHSWPRNVREILKLARRLAVLADQEIGFDLDLLPHPLQAPIRSRSDGGTKLHSPDAPEPGGDGEDVGPGRSVLEEALRAAQGNVSKVAEQIGCHRQQVYRWLRRMRLDPDAFREP